jgi:hypothetical protein
VRLLRAVWDQPPEVFWPVWLSTWSSVDLVADLQLHLPALFKLKGPAHPFFDDAMRAMFDALPDVVTVYRECDRRFIEGIASTTDYAVAEHFARGGRYGAPRDPVIATGQIAKSSADLFYIVDERNESEIVCKPTIVQVEAFTKLIGPHIPVLSKPSKPRFECFEGEGVQPCATWVVRRAIPVRYTTTPKSPKGKRESPPHSVDG